MRFSKTNQESHAGKERASSQPFTLMGRLLLCAAGFCLLAVVDSSLAILLSYTAALLCLGFLWGLLHRPNLVARAVDVMAVAGRSEQVTISLTNQSKRPAYDLQVSIEDQGNTLQVYPPTHHIDCILGGATIELKCEVFSPIRGVFEYPSCRVTSVFPFAVFRFITRMATPGEVVVGPQPQPFEQETLQSVAAGTAADLRALAEIQQQEEYAGSVEYRPGMVVRRWDFASWARLGTPAVREYYGTSGETVLLIVDTYVSETAARPDFERRLQKSASFLQQAIETTNRVVLVLVGNASVVSATRGEEGSLYAFTRALALAQHSSEKLEPELPLKPDGPNPSDRVRVFVLSEPARQAALRSAYESQTGSFGSEVVSLW